MHEIGSAEPTFASFSKIFQGLSSNKIAASKNLAASISCSFTVFLLIELASLVNKTG